MCHVNNAKRLSAAMPPSVPPTIAPVLLLGPGETAWLVCKGSVVSPESVEDVEEEVVTYGLPSEEELTGIVDEMEV